MNKTYLSWKKSHIYWPLEENIALWFAFNKLKPDFLTFLQSFIFIDKFKCYWAFKFSFIKSVRGGITKNLGVVE